MGPKEPEPDPYFRRGGREWRTDTVCQVCVVVVLVPQGNPRSRLEKSFGPSSYFPVSSQSNSLDSLRYTTKKAARESFVLELLQDGVEGVVRGCPCLGSGRVSRSTGSWLSVLSTFRSSPTNHSTGPKRFDQDWCQPSSPFSMGFLTSKSRSISDISGY